MNQFPYHLVRVGTNRGSAPNVISPVRRQSGFSMIEVLVTLLIISLALLGTAGLQAYSMRLDQGGVFRSQAVFLVADPAERMVANTNEAIAPSTACIDAACDPTALAGFDLAQWENAVAAALPQSSWTIAHDGPANPITYTITVGWVDRQVDTTKAAYDANAQLGSSDAAGTGERFFYTATRTIFN